MTMPPAGIGDALNDLEEHRADMLKKKGHPWRLGRYEPPDRDTTGTQPIQIGEHGAAVEVHGEHAIERALRIVRLVQTADLRAEDDLREKFRRLNAMGRCAPDPAALGMKQAAMDAALKVVLNVEQDVSHSSARLVLDAIYALPIPRKAPWWRRWFR